MEVWMHHMVEGGLAMCSLFVEWRVRLIQEAPLECSVGVTMEWKVPMAMLEAISMPVVNVAIGRRRRTICEVQTGGAPSVAR